MHAIALAIHLHRAPTLPTCLPDAVDVSTPAASTTAVHHQHHQHYRYRRHDATADFVSQPKEKAVVVRATPDPAPLRMMPPALPAATTEQWEGPVSARLGTTEENVASAAAAAAAVHSDAVGVMNFDAWSNCVQVRDGGGRAKEEEGEGKQAQVQSVASEAMDDGDDDDDDDDHDVGGKEGGAPVFGVDGGAAVAGMDGGDGGVWESADVIRNRWDKWLSFCF